MSDGECISVVSWFKSKQTKKTIQVVSSSFDLLCAYYNIYIHIYTYRFVSSHKTNTFIIQKTCPFPACFVKPCNHPWGVCARTRARCQGDVGRLMSVNDDADEPSVIMHFLNPVNVLSHNGCDGSFPSWMPNASRHNIGDYDADENVIALVLSTQPQKANKIFVLPDYRRFTWLASCGRKGKFCHCGRVGHIDLSRVEPRTRGHTNW